MNRMLFALAGAPVVALTTLLRMLLPDGIFS